MALAVDSTSTAASTDYELDPATLPTITIAAGQTEASETFELDPAGDTLDEDDETVVITATASSGDDTLDVTDATLTIADDDTLSGQITLSIDTTSIGEGDSPTTVTATATWVGAAQRTADTDVALSLSGTATEGSTGDYTLGDGEPGTVTIPEGQSSGTATFTVTPVHDTVAEVHKTIVVSGAACATATDPCPAADAYTVSGPLTIDFVDDESRGITLSLDDSNISEDEPRTKFTLTATRDPAVNGAAVTVEVTVGGTGSTADRGPDDDYGGTSTVQISIAENEAIGERRVLHRALDRPAQRGRRDDPDHRRGDRVRGEPGRAHPEQRHRRPGDRRAHRRRRDRRGDDGGRRPTSR